MEEYCWPQYDISIPKANTLLVILFFIPASKSTIQYGHIDTLNSKIHRLVIILSQNRKEQKYIDPPSPIAFIYLNDPTIKFMYLK